ATRLVAARIENSCLTFESKHRLKRRSGWQLPSRSSETFRRQAGDFFAQPVPQRIQMMNAHPPKYAVLKPRQPRSHLVRGPIILTVDQVDSSQCSFLNQSPGRAKRAKVTIVLSDQKREIVLFRELNKLDCFTKAHREWLFHHHCQTMSQRDCHGLDMIVR